MRKIKVLLLMGGGGSEHSVSLSSGQEVMKNFDLNKYEVVLMVLETNELNIEEVKRINPDVVFIVIHGGIGEDGTIQKILENEGIKFIGSGSETSKLGMDKIRFLEMMSLANIPTPRDVIAKKGELVDLDEVKEIGNKWVIKPSNQGSSVGVSIVDNLNNLDKALELAFEYDDKVIIEEFIEGVEVSCGVLGNEVLTALPLIEICPKNTFFDFEAKYTIGKSDEIVPARVSGEVTKMVQDYSLKIFRLAGARGFVRFDLIIKDNKPYFLEMNTIPGLTPNSLLPKEAKAAGINYSQLLDKMIEMARE